VSITAQALCVGVTLCNVVHLSHTETGFMTYSQQACGFLLHSYRHCQECRICGAQNGNGEEFPFQVQVHLDL
jgi:hypothetical protein